MPPTMEFPGKFAIVGETLKFGCLELQEGEPALAEA